MVAERGFEPPRVAPLRSERSASTSFTTRPNLHACRCLWHASQRGSHFCISAMIAFHDLECAAMLMPNLRPFGSRWCHSTPNAAQSRQRTTDRNHSRNSLKAVLRFAKYRCCFVCTGDTLAELVGADGVEPSRPLGRPLYRRPRVPSGLRSHGARVRIRTARHQPLMLADMPVLLRARTSGGPGRIRTCTRPVLSGVPLPVELQAHTTNEYGGGDRGRTCHALRRRGFRDRSACQLCRRLRDLHGARAGPGCGLC
jgi:hypothetical protein